jgi:nucleotide-binding universal stress UspA family protein
MCLDMFKRILIAIDGSEGATNALCAAIELASVNEAELVVLNIFNASEHFGGQGSVAFGRAEHLQGGYAEAKEIFSQNLLAGAKALVAGRPGLHASFVSLDGDAANEILKYAQEIRADTIVLGSRGLGRLAGLLLGSVSQKVASLARQPVLIVPTGR